jgi:hypothetical protein
MPLAVPDEQSMMLHTWHVVMAANPTSGYVVTGNAQ